MFYKMFYKNLRKFDIALYVFEIFKTFYVLISSFPESRTLVALYLLE